MIYKILTAIEWEEFQTDGVFEGAPVDLSDGFIHFSAREQVAGTAKKHFAGQSELIVCGVDESQLSELRWEASREGDKFPHLYATLNIADVLSSQSLDDFLSG